MNTPTQALFRKKPVVVVVVEAVQLTKSVAWDNLVDKVPLPFGVGIAGASWNFDLGEIYEFRAAIKTLEGTMHASIGDWIIKGVKGELYPCKPDIFREIYEPAPEGQDT